VIDAPLSASYVWAALRPVLPEKLAICVQFLKRPQLQELEIIFGKDFPLV